jgi:opacity protein-like surface antigen
MRKLIAITFAVVIGVTGTQLEARTPTVDELYQIILRQQKTIDNLTQVVTGLHNSNSARQVVKAPKPEITALIDRIDAVDEKLKSLTSKPTELASVSTDEVAQSKGEMEEREAVNSNGFYVTVFSEYAVPEDVNVTDTGTKKNGRGSLSEGLNLGFATGYRFNEHLRGDMEFGRRTHELEQIISNRGSRDLSGEAEVYSAIVNGYFDFQNSRV